MDSRRLEQVAGEVSQPAAERVAAAVIQERPAALLEKAWQAPSKSAGPVTVLMPASARESEPRRVRGRKLARMGRLWQ
jgi:hypothetical protein